VRVINGCFIVLFMAMLMLPFVFVDLSADRVSVEENRMLAPRPKLTDIKNHPGTFIRGFDTWFKDSTGFREQLLALYNVMSKKEWFNGIWYADGSYFYLIGKEGHRYFAHTSGRLIRVFQGAKILSDEQLENMAVKLEEVKAYLDGKSIPLVVMFCTTKESIYPEFYPMSIKRGPEPIQLDVITRYLQEHTSVDVFNIRQALLAEKDNYALYPVSSGDLVHYTELGAFFAYRELMKHINAYFPGIVPYDLNDIDISYDEKGIPHVSIKKETTYKKLDSSFFDDVKYDNNLRLFNAAFENTDPNLPVILLLRDSYVEESLAGKYVASHFGKTIMLYFSNMESIEDYITRYKPDIVIFESAEFNLERFADCVAKIPKLPGGDTRP